jgi:tetratricopeptide (TPR) repeat protein
MGIAAGTALLEAGQTIRALDVFSELLAGMGARPTAELLQYVGICQRMLGEYDESERMFGKAYEVAAGNDSHKGRIMRDWGMVPLSKGDAATAKKCFEESLALLHGRENVVEHATTMGFVGRAYLIGGDRKSAAMYFKMADLELRKPDSPHTYELNNLVWWMKAVGLLTRLQLALRAMPLARAKRNKKRQVQIVLLAILGRPRGY